MRTFVAALLTVLQASAANRKKTIRSTWAVGMSKAMAQNVSQEKVRLFSEAFAKIQEATGAMVDYLCNILGAHGRTAAGWLLSVQVAAIICSQMGLCTLPELS